MEVTKSESFENKVLTSDNRVKSEIEDIPVKEEYVPSEKNEVVENTSLNGGESHAESPEESKEGDEDVDKNDPYAYLNRDEFSSENFKIEIQNLPKYFGVGQLKKFLTRQGVNAHKIKMMAKNFVFITFKCESDRQEGMAKLENTIFKGSKLSVKLAKALQDPLIKKRKAEEEDNEKDDQKKIKIIEPIEDLIKKVTVPYVDKPYNEQLELKRTEMEKFLADLTREIGKANERVKPFIRVQKKKFSGLVCPLTEVIPSPALEKYRNKCEFTVGINPEDNELTVGFRVSSYKKGSFAVGPVHHLPHLPDSMKNAVKLLEGHFRASSLKAFDAEDHSGTWRQVTVRTNFIDEVMVIVVVHPQKMTEPELEQVKAGLVDLAAKNSSLISSLYFQALGAKKSGEDPPVEHLSGSTHLQEKLCGLNFSVSPLAFFQVNTLAAEALYNKIGDLAQVDAETNILDVCCGTGTIGLSIAKKCRRVFGVELIASAVEDAKKNAENNGLTNTVFVAGKAEEMLFPLIKQIDDEETTSTTPQKIVAVLDPPRAGLHKRCCQVLRNNKRIERLIYVSCSPQGAMRSFVDLCRAESNAYGGVPFFPTQAIAVDLFPDTPHCELIVVLERYNLVSDPSRNQPQSNSDITE